jgi:hypothetical protein
MKRFVLTLATVATLALGGCAQNKVPPLYGWYSYQTQLDNWYRQNVDSPDVQLKKMQADLGKIQAANENPPPGFRAHMGLLHGHLGDLVSLQRELEAEKAAFPESAGYMDFLLRNFKKP